MINWGRLGGEEGGGCPAAPANLAAAPAPQGQVSLCHPLVSSSGTAGRGGVMPSEQDASGNKSDLMLEVLLPAGEAFGARCL